MKTSVLVAGVGNIFFKDDGFGVELARRLAETDLPPHVAVRDFGTGGLHLAFELLAPIEHLVIADAIPRGGAPGTLYVVEPEIEDGSRAVAGSGHGMDLSAVFAQVQIMGGSLPPITLVGCEPETVAEGIGLSAPVARSIEPALDIVHNLLRRPRAQAFDR